MSEPPAEFPGARLLARVSRLVPPARRIAWRREWEAEAAYAWQVMRRNGPPSSVDVMKLRLRVATCVFDALWERKETMKMTGLINDVRQAVRGLLRYPSFTAIAVLTLGLGIGANTAVFTLVDGVLLSPLPFDAPDELVALRHQGRDGADQLPMSDGLFRFYEEQATSVEGIALHSRAVVNLVSDGEPERVAAQVVTPGFFEVLGVAPVLGRTFTDAEGGPDGERVAILSDGFWEQRFGRDPSVLGRSLDVNGRPSRIVGVMPPDFGHPDRDARFWLPYRIDPAQAPLASFGANGIARLAEGSSIDGLDAELRGLVTRLSDYFPENGGADFLRQVGLTPIVLPLHEDVVGDAGRTLWVLLGTVGFVLLIACANVANLLLVRAESRQRELALRVAVGAGRAQVLRTFLSESAALAIAGSALGMVISTLAVRLTLANVPADIPRIAEVGVDLRVLSFTLVLTVGCALFFGLFPLLRHRPDAIGAHLRDGGARGATGGRETNRLRNLLVMAQMALALVLLVGSGLMFRSFQALRGIDPGFDAGGVVTARINVPPSEIEAAAATMAFFQTLRDRLEAQPGVESVGFAQSAPLTSGLPFWGFELRDRPGGEDGETVFAAHNQVSPGYLEAMGIELVEGRTFQSGDGLDGFPAAIVDRSFAEHWWPGESPLGRRIDWNAEGAYTIVGVVEDARYYSLEGTPTETVYWPLQAGSESQPAPARNVDVVLRTAGDPTAFVSVVRREVQSLNARIPVSNPRTMADVVSSAAARTSFTMALLGAASGIALLLGLIGIYGVISYIVSQRTREIGVRMALGASGPSVRSMVVRHGLKLAAGGVAAGLVAAAVLSRVMASLLYGVSAIDPVTYGAVAVAMVAVSLAGSWIPATRAAGVDPSSALRSE